MSREEIALELIKHVYENALVDPKERIDAYFYVLEKFKKVGKI